METTKLDITALKKATHISFKHDSNDEDFIIATKEPSERDKETNPFAIELKHVIKINSNLNGNKRAFEMIVFSEHDTRWQTVTSFIKKGDIITLKWSDGGYTNESMRKAGFIGHGLSLRIKRETKKETKHFEFLITTQCVPENSPAAMIR